MRLILTVFFVTALVFLPGPVAAFDLEENLRELHAQYAAKPELQVTQSGGKSLSDAIAEIRKRTGGKVVGAETKVRNGREVHEIKVLTKDGKVKKYKVNGRRR